MTREELGAKVRRLQQAVAEVQGNTHLDGVTVRTDANGRLTELSIAHDAWARGPEALADTIVLAYRHTADDVRQRSTAIMAELRDDPIVARIADATTCSAFMPENRPNQGTDSVAQGSRPPDEIQNEQTADNQKIVSPRSSNRSADRRLSEDDIYEGYQPKSWLQ